MMDVREFKPGDVAIICGTFDSTDAFRRVHEGRSIVVASVNGCAITPVRSGYDADMFLWPSRYLSLNPVTTPIEEWLLLHPWNHVRVDRVDDSWRGFLPGMHGLATKVVRADRPAVGLGGELCSTISDGTHTWVVPVSWLTPMPCGERQVACKAVSKQHNFMPGDRVRIVGGFSGDDAWRNSHRGEVIEIDKFQFIDDVAYASPADSESRANLYLWPLNSIEPAEEPVAPEKPIPLRKPFYMVKGSGPANFKHGSRDSAIKEASRLAEIHGGQEFHVLVSICTVKSAGIEITKHEVVSTADDSDVPF